jgi:plastocyanin
MWTTRNDRAIGRGVVLVAVAGAIALSTAACGADTGSGTTTTTSAPATTGPSTQVTATLTEFHLALSVSTFAAGSYTFDAKNAGSATHALAIHGPGVAAQTAALQPGQDAKLTVVLAAGSYDVYCPIDGHKMLGMDSTITVGAAPAQATSSAASTGGGGTNGY